MLLFKSTPHPCELPSDSCAKDTLGGVVSPFEALPQQMAALFEAIPHEAMPPDDIWENDPDGGVACLLVLEPQHTTEPSTFRPQVCW
jgi:hypothetical protein